MPRKIIETINYDTAIEEYNAAKSAAESTISDLVKLQTELQTNICQSFPYLGKIMAELKSKKAETLANWLSTKKYGVNKTAEEIKKDLKQDLSVMTQRAIEAEAKLAYYEHALPVAEMLEDGPDVTIKTTDEEQSPENKYLTQEEYAQLTEQQRRQRALDNYKHRHKTRREIGRDYERYVGYHYEKLGYRVEYKGILAGLEDLGRDLICTKGRETLIIQCKYWSKDKTIHEKHINQLFGTYMEYMLKAQKQGAQTSVFDAFELARDMDCKAAFWTHTTLSDTAKSFAKALKIEIHENEDMGDYPMIKCNVSRRTEEKIYHLPFDLNYDEVVIEPNKKEFYAMTIAEAEGQGFRRAFKWHGTI